MRRHVLVSLLALVALVAVPALSAAKPGGHGHCGKHGAKTTGKHAKRCAKQRAAAKDRAVNASDLKACRDEQAADPAAFQTKYANADGGEGLGRCVHQHAAGHGEPAAPNTSSPAQRCHAEQVADSAAFQAKYADENGHEPFGRCVSQHAHEQHPAADHPAESETTDPPEHHADAPAHEEHHPAPAPTAAQQRCHSEQVADPAAFQAKYADAEGHEAFGRCVATPAA